jgi:hypothetical protein
MKGSTVSDGRMCYCRGVRPEIPLFVPEKLSLLAQQCWHQDPSSSLNSLRYCSRFQIFDVIECSVR